MIGTVLKNLLRIDVGASRRALSRGLDRAGAARVCRMWPGAVNDSEVVQRKFNELRNVLVEKGILKEEKMAETSEFGNVAQMCFYVALCLLTLAVIALAALKARGRKTTQRAGMKPPCFGRSGLCVEIYSNKVLELLKEYCRESVDIPLNRFYVSKESLQKLSILKFRPAVEFGWNECVSEIVARSDGKFGLIKPQTGDIFNFATMKAKDQMLSGKKTVVWTNSSFVGIISNVEKQVLERAFVEIEVEHGGFAK